MYYNQDATFEDQALTPMKISYWAIQRQEGGGKIISHLCISVSAVPFE
jgi:hypothetical protein